MRSFLFIAAIFFGSLAVVAAQEAPKRLTNEQILEAQANYYGLLVQRLSQDLADTKAVAAEREKAWADYSKPLWQSPEQHSENAPPGVPPPRK